jgi:3-hydroxybutyryl-CoA dehydrogenase
MGDHYGAASILKILTHLQAGYGDPRYRPSPWLRRRAALGLSLTHPEG